MKGLPAHLRYTLNRRQRLIPHLIGWGAMGPCFVAFCVMFLAAAFFISAWFFLATLMAAWFGSNYIYGFVDVWLNPIREMDVVIEPLGIGYLAGNERWYVHMDGVLSIKQLTNDLWTILHHNGTVINVPTETMPDYCVAHIRAAIAEGWIYLQPFADEHKRKLDASSTTTSVGSDLSANDGHTP